jgi:hypothetical protein
MLRLTSEKIAEAARVGVAKVKKDITKGKLDSESLEDIVRYILGYRMLSDGLKMWDGVMESVEDKFPDIPKAYMAAPEVVGHPRCRGMTWAGIGEKEKHVEPTE